jgi:hypothetical protein
LIKKQSTEKNDENSKIFHHAKIIESSKTKSPLKETKILQDMSFLHMGLKMERQRECRVC